MGFSFVFVFFVSRCVPGFVLLFEVGESVVYYNITAQRLTPTKNVTLKHVVQNIVDYFFYICV